MNDDVVTVEATFTHLDSGWGARVVSMDNLTGRQVILTRKNGGEARKRLGKCVQRYPKSGIALYTFYGEDDEPRKPRGENQLQALVGKPLSEDLRKAISSAIESEDDDEAFKVLLAIADYFDIS